MISAGRVTLAWAVICAGATAWAQDPKLSFEQQNKLRAGKFDKNAKEKVVAAILADHAAVKGKEDVLIPPATLKKALADIATVQGVCTNTLKGFEEVKMPEEHSEAKPVKAWAQETLTTLDPLRKDYEKRLPEMEKLADAKSYPDFEKDVAALEEVIGDFRQGLRGKVEDVAGRASRFPELVKWQSAKVKQYNAFMVLNAGSRNPLAVKFERAADVLKEFQIEATKYVDEAQKGVPAQLKDAEEMAAKAAAEKKPLFFKGGVRQKMEQANEKISTCEGLLGKDSESAAALRKQYDAAAARIDQMSASLKELILAESRAPKETYAGADREEFRKKIQEEWKKAYPQETVLEVRFPGTWERKTEWRIVDNAFQKVDLSFMIARVIVKTTDKVATVYAAVVNKDHLQGDRISYFVQTKKGIWTIQEVLVENLKK